MTTCIKISIALTLFLLGTVSLSAQNNSGTIVGSGKIINKTVTTQAYNAIKVSGSMDVFLKKGKEGTIDIAAEDNVMDRVVVESDGETLIISMKNNTSLLNTKTIKITVPVEEISEITLRGSGDIESADLLKTDSMSLGISGSGEIDLLIEANTLEANIHGSGDMELSGKVADVLIESTGSGNFEGKKLVADNAEINISGSSDATIFANKILKVSIQGSGSVLYAGNPNTDAVKIRGSGKVKSL